MGKIFLSRFRAISPKMNIPDKIKHKSTRKPLIFLPKKTAEIVQVGWIYLALYFKDEKDYFGFLERLSGEKFEKFLRSIFFYYAHDLYRLIQKSNLRENIDGFMFQNTLSIIEYLNQDISDKSRKRVRVFFADNLSKGHKNYLNDKIRAYEKNSASTPIKKDAWDILLDVRNRFIHAAKWFSLIRENGEEFAALSLSKDTNGKEYFADIRIRYLDYLNIFWMGFLMYFGKKIN